MRIVDAHHHLWDPTAVDYALLRPDGRLGALARPFLARTFDAVARENGVSEAVAVEAASAGADIERETEWLLAQAGGSAVSRRVVACAPLEEPRLRAWLDALPDRAAAAGVAVVGVRRAFEGVPDGFILSPAVAAGIREVAARGLTFDLVLFGDRLAEAVELAARLPEATFLLDHLAKPRIEPDAFDRWRRELSAMARLPNVTAKVSGLVTEVGRDDWEERLRPYVEHAAEAFGWRRLMFGSDWPICELAGGYRRWLDYLLGIVDEASEDERAAFLAGTADRVYRAA